MFEIVNLAVNVCLDLIGCFEVVPLTSTPSVIEVGPTKGSPSSFSFFQHKQKALLGSLFLLCELICL